MATTIHQPYVQLDATATCTKAGIIRLLEKQHRTYPEQSVVVEIASLKKFLQGASPAQWFLSQGFLETFKKTLLNTDVDFSIVLKITPEFFEGITYSTGNDQKNTWFVFNVLAISIDFWSQYARQVRGIDCSGINFDAIGAEKIISFLTSINFFNGKTFNTISLRSCNLGKLLNRLPEIRTGEPRSYTRGEFIEHLRSFLLRSKVKELDLRGNGLQQIDIDAIVKDLPEGTQVLVDGRVGTRVIRRVQSEASFDGGGASTEVAGRRGLKRAQTMAALPRSMLRSSSLAAIPLAISSQTPGTKPSPASTAQKQPSWFARHPYATVAIGVLSLLAIAALVFYVGPPALLVLGAVAKSGALAGAGTVLAAVAAKAAGYVTAGLGCLLVGVGLAKGGKTLVQRAKACSAEQQAAAAKEESKGTGRAVSSSSTDEVVVADHDGRCITPCRDLRAYSQLVEQQTARPVGDSKGVHRSDSRGSVAEVELQTVHCSATPGQTSNQ